MKSVLASILIWLAAVVLPLQGAWAADSAAGTELTAICAPAVDARTQPFATSFPAMSPAEQEFSLARGGFPDCRPEAGGRFKSFAQVPIEDDHRLRDYWLVRARLLPTYPATAYPVLLPLGWQWLEFSRQAGY